MKVGHWIGQIKYNIYNKNGKIRVFYDGQIKSSLAEATSSL